MRRNDPVALPIAVRVYPAPRADKSASSQKSKTFRVSDVMFVFDTETRTDATQSLVFGSYRVLQKGQCIEEALFFADDISDEERQALWSYASARHADIVSDGPPRLPLL